MSKIAGMELSDIALVAGLAGAAFLLYKPLSTATDTFKKVTDPIAQVENTAANAFDAVINNPISLLNPDAFSGIGNQFDVWAYSAWNTISGWFS